MKQDLLYHDPYSFRKQTLNKETILEWFDQCDAAWMHDGDVKKPHAKLRSGKCSNGYFNCSLILCYPNICQILGYQLGQLFLSENGFNPDWVVSSSYAAIIFGHEVAKTLGAKFGFTEKDPEDPKKQIWKRFTIPENSRVLQVEELITTSSTFKAVRQAIEKENSETVDFCDTVCTLVHRPPKLPIDYDDRIVLALVEEEVWAIEPENCPLCKAGSECLEAKKNWAKLTGKA